MDDEFDFDADAPVLNVAQNTEKPSERPVKRLKPSKKQLDMQNGTSQQQQTPVQTPAAPLEESKAVETPAPIAVVVSNPSAPAAASVAPASQSVASPDVVVIASIDQSQWDSVNQKTQVELREAQEKAAAAAAAAPSSSSSPSEAGRDSPISVLDAVQSMRRVKMAENPVVFNDAAVSFSSKFRYLFSERLSQELQQQRLLFFQFAATSLDYQHIETERVLTSFASCLLGQCPPRYSSMWERVGFQGLVSHVIMCSYAHPLY